MVTSQKTGTLIVLGIDFHFVDCSVYEQLVNEPKYCYIDKRKHCKLSGNVFESRYFSYYQRNNR